MSLEKIKLSVNNSQTINNIPQNTVNAIKENENIFENNNTTYNVHNPEFDDNWEDVEYNQNKALGFLWNTGTYTYTTSNGSTITVKDTDGIIIKQNKQTGEIVIIGGQDNGNVEDINLSEGDNLTLIEATAKNINAKNGDATIKIEGSHASVASVNGGKGSQNVIVSAGAKVEKINTGDDDDTVIVNNSTVGKVETGKGNDGVIAYNSNITNNVNLGKNDDYLLVTDTSIQGKVTTGKGNDIIEGSNAEFNGEINSNSNDEDTNTINLESSKINDDIIAYNGNADIVIKDGSTIAENKMIETGYGNYNVSVENSNLDGNLVASGFDGQGGYGTFNLNLNNSSFNNISGLRNDDTTTFNSFNSKSNGAENLENSNNSKKEVANLNTTEGEFQGYELVNSESVDTRKTYTVKISDTQTKTVSEEEWNQIYSSYYMLLSENVQNVYTLSDGTIVSMNEGGQLYRNEQGDIVINGADKAEITGGNNANGKITVINSYVVSHNNVHGSIEYRNSYVDTINVSDCENAQITVKDDSRVGDLTSSNTNLTVNISDTSKINNLNSLEDGVLNINSNGGEISKIQSDKANIIGNIQNSTIGTIKTNKGSIDITASGTKDSETGKIIYCHIDEIINNNKDGETKLNLAYAVSDKISSKSKSVINLDNCTITSKVTASDYQDLISIIDSEVKNLEAQQGDDNLFIQGSSFDTLTALGMTQTTLDGVDIQKFNIHGDIAVNKSDIDNFSVFGNIAINASEIDEFDVSGNISNVDIEDSFIKNSYSLYDDNVHIDYFGDETNYGNIDETQLAIVSSQLEKLSQQEMDDVYTLLESLENGDSETISELTSQNLTKEEIIKRLNENPSETIVQIEQGLIAEMQGAIKTLEQALEDDKESGGSWLLTSIINSISNDINASNIQAKKEMLSKAIESGDFESLLNAYSILTDEISATKAINEYNEALNYASSMSHDDIGKVLTTLGYIGNLMEYNITEQDGIIKNGIAYLNMYFDIGTNRNEAVAYVQTYKDSVNNLVEKYENGTLTNEELISEYKRLTGNSFTKDNIETILNNDRNDDVFENNAQEKIEDYQKTQQTIMQVGEYTITIAAGTVVTLVSGGAAGPAIASALSTLGKMGIALTATTVSFFTKTAIEAMERQTNGIVADDMTAEEIATQAALMYAGCFCGQFGNAVGDYMRVNAPEFLSQFISSKEMVNIATKVLGKTLEVTSDTSASVLTTAMITGSGEWNEEFMQNLRSEMIGLIQSKITGAYFKAHPDLQINTQLYSMRKGLTGLAEAEANIQVLKQFGFSDSDAGKLSTLTSDEVDTIILLKATNDLCDASLKSHGIDISKLSAEEKIEQGKIVDDLYANADKITQQTDNTCSVVSVLNAINDKPILLQALANKFEYDFESDTYKFNMFGEDFEVKLNEGDNLLQKAYEAYQIQYGDTKTSAIDVFNAMLDGACDILVRPNSDIAQTLKGYTEDDSSILTFNTTDKIDGISSDHSYTVLSVDDMGNMRLQDPDTLEEITLMRSDYENKDCQIQGKTYKDNGIVDDTIELKLAAGVKTENNDVAIDSTTEEKLSLESKILQQIIENDCEYQLERQSIEDIVRGINCAIERAKKAGIELTEDDILDICKAKNEYSATNIITSLTSMTELPRVGYAMVVAQLKNSGLITDEMIENITGAWSIARGIEECYSPNLSQNPKKDYFKILLQTCGFDENKINAITTICKGIGKGRIQYSEVKDIISNAQTMSSTDLQIETIIVRYKALFGDEDTMINDFRQQIEQLKQNSWLSLDDISYDIEDLENFADNYPEIIQLYHDGKIDNNMFRNLYMIGCNTPNVMDIYTNILKDPDLSEIRIDDMSKLVNLSETQRNEVINLIKENKVVNIDDAINIVGSAKQAYHRFIDMGMDSITASVIANIKGIDQYSISEIESIKSILDCIHTTSNSDTRISQVVSDYLVSNPNINIGELADYISDIDFDKLSEIAPAISQFGPEQFFKFCTYYYADGQKTQFTKEDLTLDKDFTSFLMTHYLDNKTLTDLLSIYPNTPREVGVIPDGWFENVEYSNKAQAQQEIYQAISNFQENHDINILSEEMSRITGKKVTIKELGSGVFGTGYKISMDGAQDMCLKIFNTSSNRAVTSDMFNVHGQHVEVQTGLFVNEHSSDFVKMYFGRVAPNNMSDGFLVTQYLSDDITPDSSVGNDTDSYTVTSTDAYPGHNMINGKIIDFGGVNIQRN